MRFFFLPVLFSVFLIDAGKGSGSSPVDLADTSKTATDSILHFWLDKQVVENNHPTFNSLWLLLSPAELDSIESSKSLFRKFPFGSFTTMNYFTNINHSRYDKQPIAQILRSSNNLRLHNAWPSYWSLLNEFQYPYPNGNQLIQVFLEDSALIVSFSPKEKNPFQVFDVKGNPVSLPDALKRESQIAVVYINEHVKGTYITEIEKVKTREVNVNMHCRSFFVFNEKMIKHWQHATPSMQHGILKDIDYLLLLEAWMKENAQRPALAGKHGKNIVTAWNKPNRERSIQEKIFSTWRYSDETNLDVNYIQSTLKSVREIWPLQKNPKEKFPSRGIR